MNIYAKYDFNGGSLPLETHLKDTQSAGEYLFDYWLADSIKKFLCDELAITDGQLRSLMILICRLHDIGKATFYFQKGAWETLREDSPFLAVTPPKLRDRKRLHHSTMGAAFLKKMDFDEGIVTVVGSHHGKWRCDIQKDYFLRYSRYFDGKPIQSGNEGFPEERRRIITTALEETGFEISTIPKLNEAAQILLTGFLNMADWLASDTRYFPLYQEESGQGKEACRTPVQKFQITPAWESHLYWSDNESFKARFKFEPRFIQNDVISMMNDLEEPGLLIIEAPMGMGKTEAALLAAERMAYERKASGLFFGLPTIATSNGLLERVYQWALQEAEDEKYSFQLVHSKVDFNEEYQSIRQRDYDEEDLAISRWMEKRKLKLCPNFVMGTIDCLLKMSLKHTHFMLDHIGVAGKVIIMDEIHSFDTYTGEYIKRTLEWLGNYHTPAILLSATLNTESRLEIVEAYMKGKGVVLTEKEKKDIKTNDSYPLLTCTAKEGVVLRKSKESVPEGTVHLLKMDSWSEIQNLIENRLAEGGCAGIIVNTIQQAQLLYRELKELDEKGFRTELIHSSFTDGDRAQKEKKLLKIIGKPRLDSENEQRKSRDRFIVIGTQVLEQSLDIDFDLLITEVCPVDLLFQRIGRLHRHPRKRPDLLKEPLCIVVGTELESLNDGTRSIYSDWLLYKTLDLLKERDQMMIPADIPVLINTLYQDSVDLNDQEAQIFSEFRKKQAAKKERADVFRLPEPGTSRRALREMLKTEIPAYAERLGNQAVRDCLYSLEVILIRTDFQEMAWTTSGAGISLLNIPDEHTILEIKRLTIKLPARMIKANSLKNLIEELERNSELFSQWKKSKGLSRELFLPLDVDGKGEVGEWDISYSPEYGLCCEKRQEGIK